MLRTLVAPFHHSFRSMHGSNKGDRKRERGHGAGKGAAKGKGPDGGKRVPTEGGGGDGKRARSAEQATTSASVPPPARRFEPEDAVLPHFGDASALAVEFFQWMIHPITVEEFYSTYWEKKPLHIARGDESYYRSWFSKRDIELMLSEGDGMQYAQDLDVTLYKDGRRTTLNGEGRATPERVWSLYKEQGCSVRLLHPQSHSDALHRMLMLLEAHWSSFAGCNAYLTPGGSAGFAPHYDDIEAFLLQVEGAKHWRVFKPLAREDILPRESSGNFDEATIGEPELTPTLRAGDLLYMPRGYIHQARSPKGVPFSLHVTVSTAQKNTWIDLMEHALPLAMDAARSKMMVLRHSLPQDYLLCAGLQHADKKTERRAQFLQLFSSLLHKVVDEMPADDAVDELALRLVHDNLPPVLSEEALKRRWEGLTADLKPKRKASQKAGVGGGGDEEGGSDDDGDDDDDDEEEEEDDDNDDDDAADEDDEEEEDGKGGAGGAKCALVRQRLWRRKRALIKGRALLQLHDAVRIVRRGAARLLVDAEGERAVVYHIIRNARVYRDEELQGVEVGLDQASAVEAILDSYPMPVCVRDLPVEVADPKAANASRLQLANKLFKHGIVIAESTGEDEARRALFEVDD